MPEMIDDGSMEALNRRYEQAMKRKRGVDNEPLSVDKLIGNPFGAVADPGDPELKKAQEYFKNQ